MSIEYYLLIYLVCVIVILIIFRIFYNIIYGVKINKHIIKERDYKSSENLKALKGWHNAPDYPFRYIKPNARIKMWKYGDLEDK